MSLIGEIRRFLLREHEQEHAHVDRHLAAADTELTALEVRVRRLEIEKRLRERRLGGS